MSRREEPAAVAARLEQHAAVPGADGEHFVGYSVMGLPFGGGDVLALRRFPATSFGPPYTSVWHRSPDGRWTFYADVPSAHGCSSYWHALIDGTVVAPIRIEWTGPRHLAISVDSGRAVAWSLTLDRTWASALLTGMARVLPRAWWSHPWLSRVIGGMAGAMLSAGPMSIHGQTPSGHAFTAIPQVVWTVTASRATVHGRDLGTPAPLKPRARLGDFAVPQRGIFAAGLITMRKVQP